MILRTLILAGLLFVISGCSTSQEETDVGEMVVEERQDITAGPLEGTEVYDREVLDGPVPGTQQDLVVNIGDRVFFDFDRYDLTPEGQRILDAQAQWLQQYPNLNVTIEGHCDERGTREYNLALGERRANSVRSYLVALGVDPNRIAVISYGKERPAVLGSNPSAWAQNRRAVTIVE